MLRHPMMERECLLVRMFMALPFVLALFRSTQRMEINDNPRLKQLLII